MSELVHLLRGRPWLDVDPKTKLKCNRQLAATDDVVEYTVDVSFESSRSLRAIASCVLSLAPSLRTSDLHDCNLSDDELTLIRDCLETAGLETITYL